MATTKTYQQMTRREKLSHLKSLTDNAAKRVQGSKSDWREFLRFYAKLYKYPFPEALLIYEQNPKATACGEIQHWNKVGRRIHRGTKGIPVINDADKNMNIRYVFDISDTYGEDRGIPRHWTLPEKHMDAVVSELQTRFKVPPPTDNQSKNLKWAVEEYTRESCQDFLSDIQYDADGSSLGNLDDDNIRKEFTDTVVDSVGYLISERLGLAQGLYNDDDLSFEFLHDFTTKAALCQAGAVIGQISRNVLTLIAETIRNEQKIERMKNDDERRQIYDRGIDSGFGNDGGGNRGNGSEPRPAGTVTADRQVRQSVPKISSGEPSGTARVSAGGNDAAGHLRTSGSGSAGADGDIAKSATRRTAETERRLHGDGAIQHNDSGSGGGDRAEGDRVQKEITFSEEVTAVGENPPLSVSPGDATDVTAPKPPNFRITPDIDIGGGGAKTKYRRNVEAIRILKSIESENRYATPDEQATMALYIGWGGISQVFKEGHADWQSEYAELKNLLSESEYRAAAGSTLNAHYARFVP